MSNSAIKALCLQIEQDLNAAESSQDVAASVQRAVEYGKPLVYNHGFHYLIGVMMIIAGAIGCYIFWFAYVDYPYPWMYRDDDVLGIFCALLALGGLVPMVIAYRDSSKLEALAKRAYGMDARMDNGLTPKPFPDEETIKLEFSEFIRGNYSREFKEYLHGNWQGKEHGFEYDYFHYHYVTQTQRTRTVRDSKGNTSTRTETVYHHYDRYGLIIEFPYAKEIQICNDGLLARPYKETYESGSIKFNQHYVVKAESQQAAAKLLKPSIVIAMEILAGRFNHPNIEISAQGRLCFSFNDSDALKGDQKYNFSQPENFYNELIGRTALNRLDDAFKFLHQLIKHSDNNFDNHFDNKLEV